MSKLALVLLLAIAASLSLSLSREARSTQHVSASAESDRLTITSVLGDQQLAWNRGDVSGFMRGYWNSPELTFSGSSGVARGWEAVLERYKRQYPDRAEMGQLDFSGIEIRFLGPDAALILGKWRLQRNSGDLAGVFTLVFQREPEGWRIVHDHTSLVKTAAE